jgi:pimeloyl-ACP methyl ester carboxylesterase
MNAIPNLRWIKRIVLGILGLVVVLLVAGYAALLRPDISYEVLERKYANPESRFVDLSGGYRLHYRDQGDPKGPTLLLIHGFGASLVDWEPWVSRLGGRYRLVSVDWPGHGLTRAPDDFVPSSANDAELIERFASAIGLGKVTVIGNSKGGEIAWVLALRHPERVERLVLVDASGWEWQKYKPSDGILLAALDSAPIAYLLRGLDKSRIIRALLTSAFFDPHLATDAMITRYVEFSRAPGHRAILDRTFVETLRGLDRDGWATRDKLAGIRVPTLIMWGDRDKLVDPGDAGKFAAAIKSSKLIVYHNVGHVPMEEVPAQSAVDLDRWLESSGGAP